MTPGTIDAAADSRSAVFILEHALQTTRARMLAAATPKVRLRLLWAGAARSRTYATGEIHQAKFFQLAEELGLTRALGRHGAEDVAHVVGWAWRGQNPFDAGTLCNEKRR